MRRVFLSSRRIGHRERITGRQIRAEVSIRPASTCTGENCESAIFSAGKDEPQMTTATERAR